MNLRNQDKADRQPNWNVDGRQCTQCERVMGPSSIDATSATVGDISLTCKQLPCLECPQKHTRIPTSPDFAESLVDALFGAGGIPAAKQKGLLRRTPCCPRCDHELGRAAARALFRLGLRLVQPGVRYEVEFETADTGSGAGDDPRVFTIELQCPAATCAACGTAVVVLGGGIASPIREALALILESM